MVHFNDFLLGIEPQQWETLAQQQAYFLFEMYPYKNKIGGVFL